MIQQGMMQDLVRRVIRSPLVQQAALASGALEEFAKPYVAGAVPEIAIDTARVLRSRGLEVSFAYLPRRDSNQESPHALEELLANLGESARGIELSVKPSHLGLRSSEKLALDTLRGLAGLAAEGGAHITLEMEGASEYSQTLHLWHQVHDEHPDLGLTLPVDIRRVERDVRTLVDESRRIRLCIGAYPLPREIGIRKEHDKQKALVRCLRIAMEAGATTMLAAHDPTIIAIMQELARRNPASPFEFQMFHGVRPLEQRRLADIGYTSRVLLPYGPGWYEYLLTSLAARPQTAWGYLRAIFDKR